MMRPDFLHKKITLDDKWAWQASQVLRKANAWQSPLDAKIVEGITSWVHSGGQLTRVQVDSLRAIALRHLTPLCKLCRPASNTPAMVTLRTIEAAYEVIAARPVAYPWRPGTIPKATKERKLKKLRKEIAAYREILGLEVS